MINQKNDSKHLQEILEFWNNRAGLGKWAGSNDIIAKQLEIKTILSYTRDGQKILDFGCGNGITAIEVARQFNVQLLGLDNAEEMIHAGNSLIKGQVLKGKVKFDIGDVESLPSLAQKFDLIYTERMIINLPDWSTQKEAIIRLTDLLLPGGQFVMCENSEDGLDAINNLRELVGLEKIIPPWHNRYLKDVEIESFQIPGIALEEINYYSSTYYFLSRVVNAWLAKQEGEDPSYDSPVNKLALFLPSLEKLGQGRIWLWRKIK
jgi:ubiquinone/menaquinone biosynthesis C-methylase UbiE